MQSTMQQTNSVVGLSSHAQAADCTNLAQLEVLPEGDSGGDDVSDADSDILPSSVLRKRQFLYGRGVDGSGLKRFWEALG